MLIEALQDQRQHRVHYGHSRLRRHSPQEVVGEEKLAKGSYDHWILDLAHNWENLHVFMIRLGYSALWSQNLKSLLDAESEPACENEV